MKKIKGIKALIQAKNELPEVNFLYVPIDADIDTGEGLKTCEFVFAENESEQLAIEKNKNFTSWLEAPMFVGILKTVNEYIPSPTTQDIIEAVLYYWEYDAFLEYD